MRLVAVCAAAWLMMAGAAGAVENQAFWGVFAETKSQKMAGMPDMSAELEGMDAEMLSQMPGMADMLAMFRPQRVLKIRLWSPGIAPEGATAWLAPPAGLKQGARLDLELYRPKPGQSTSGGDGTSSNEWDPAEIPEFAVKRYWGSSETVKPGQPEVMTWGKLSPEESRQMKEQAEKAQREAAGTYFYKPDWTTAYWPTKKQPGKIADDASLQGNWALTSSYTGSIDIDVPSTVSFLKAIEMSSPDLAEAPDLGAFIRFQWEAIPNLLGSHATIVGMQGQKTLIQWTSSEVKGFFDTTDEFMQMADVKQMVERKVFMPGTQTSVTVPAGIFEGCDFVSFTMVGYGTGTALAEGQPLPRVQTKTSLSIMLGGTQMQEGMMGMEP